MTSTSPQPRIKVHRGTYEVFELLRSNGMLDLVKANKEKGTMTVLTHLKMEYEATRDPRFRDAYEWIMKHHDDFIWGVTDGFAIG
ncbi:MAG: hypothetical protein LUO82_04900 [Methanomicrobiales archaeon]|nr:hypothetical protein [Methanomicrobiales archaeon]